MHEDSQVQILLVEDNPSDVELTLHAFARHKLANRIEVVRDGQEALDFLFREGVHTNRSGGHPRLILLNLKLPKVDGHEVLRRIRANPDTRALPIVILTASSEEQDIAESYNLGVNSYIRKPVDFEQFIEMARTVGLYWLLVNEPPPEGGK